MITEEATRTTDENAFLKDARALLDRVEKGEQIGVLVIASEKVASEPLETIDEHTTRTLATMETSILGHPVRETLGGIRAGLETATKKVNEMIELSGVMGIKIVKADK